MKRFFVAVVCCLTIGSFLVACATTASDKRGYGGKKSRSQQAQEQVVDENSTDKSK